MLRLKRHIGLMLVRLGARMAGNPDTTAAPTKVRYQVVIPKEPWIRITVDGRVVKDPSLV